MQHVLAVDLGTGGPKAAVVRADGAILQTAHAPVRLLLGPGGQAEQDPAEWWAATTGCVQRLDTERIDAIAVTAQWSGTVAVGPDDRPLMNALTWMDSRGARYVREVTGGRLRIAGFDPVAAARFVRRAGGLPGRSGKDPAAHIAWIRHQRPAVYERTRVFLEPGDYLNLRLTGRACSSYDCIALHWVTDNRDLSNVRYDPDLLRLTRLDAGRLPELVPTATVVGAVLADVATEWGVPAGTPVVTATADVHSAVVGSGAVADYAGHLYIGTSSWLSCHVPWKRTDVRHNQTTLPAAIPGRYFVANEQESAGSCLRWLEQVVLPGMSYADIDALAAAAPPGANGAMFLPWLNGERTPVDDHTLRGGLVNVSLATSQADVARAVLEGVALNSRWLLEVVEKFVHRRLDPLVFVGGGARSTVWAQILADVLQRRIRQAADPQQGNVRGAALLALLALGALGVDDIPSRVPIAGELHPRPGGGYDESYDAFRSYHRQTRGIAARINRHEEPDHGS